MLCIAMVMMMLVASLLGAVQAEMTCNDNGIGYYFLQDTAKCWAPEINEEFDGTLDTACNYDGDNNGRHFGIHGACMAIVAEINADGSSYTGPDMSCYVPYGETIESNPISILKWDTEDDCKKGVEAMMAVLASVVVPSTTTTASENNYWAMYDNALDYSHAETWAQDDSSGTNSYDYGFGYSSCTSGPCDCSSFPWVSGDSGYCDHYYSGRDQHCDACCLEADCMTPRYIWNRTGEP